MLTPTSNTSSGASLSPIQSVTCDSHIERKGWCWCFGAIDHHSDELLGWQTAKLGDPWAALESIRHGVAHAFEGFAKNSGRGLRIRYDWAAVHR
jgi:hypothetical protein